MEQHQAILDVVAGKRKGAGPKKEGNKRFPLNKITICAACAKKCKKQGYGQYKFTGSDNKNGHSDKIYSRYTCRGCGRSINRDLAHEYAQQTLNEIDFTQEGREALQKALEKVWTEQEKAETDRVKQLSAHLSDIDANISRLVDAVIDPRNADVADTLRERLNKEKESKTKAEQLLVQTKGSLRKGKQKFLDFALQFVDDLGANFFTLPLSEVERCKQIIFPDGFWVDENKKVYTPKISPLYRYRNTKKDASKRLKSIMVESG